MIQQFLAFLVILFFMARLFWQKRKKQIPANEFVFWLLFWFFGAVAIISLGWLDELALQLGLSSKGIDVLIYLALIFLIYLIFRIRIRLEKMERDITKIVREISLNKDK